VALPIKSRRFLRHRPSDIPRWARSLTHVRFCHPADRYVLDRELFEVAVAIPEGQAEFLEFCASLGIRLKKIEAGDVPVPAYPELAQPGEQILGGASAHVYIRGRFLELVIAPAIGAYSVDENDYLRAKALDELLRRPGFQFRSTGNSVSDVCVP
jgi:hypothetical protein